MRKALGQHEISIVQTTAIDDPGGLVKLTTTLAHSSGEWIASEWPVCRVADLATPHRMGAALTYARRYALFTLVGIAGEDDLDAPDLNGSIDPPPGPATSDQPRSYTSAGHQAAAAGRERRLRVRPQRILFTPENSSALRVQLLSELGDLASSDALAAWAQRSLPLKNQLVAVDAEDVESAFAAKLSTFKDVADVGDKFVQDAEAAGSGPLTTAPQAERLGRKSNLNGSRASRSEGTANHSITASSAHAAPRMANSLSKPRRLRDKEHLKFVTTQPCLICERRPSDAHHLRFIQPRALGRKVSDEHTVPLCRLHHRELHRRGHEPTWWKEVGVDPLHAALQLWRASHCGAGTGDAAATTSSTELRNQ